MDEIKPTLSDVARGVYWEEGLPIRDDALTEALLAAGIDPKDEAERARLRTLVIAVNRLRNDDRINEQLSAVSDYLRDAREIADECADIDEVIQIANELKREREDESA